MAEGEPMKKTLYLKFILAYFIFGFFGFVVIATFVSSMTLEHLKREKADSLYREAILIANTYASDLYSNQTSMETVKDQIDALDTYLNASIWIINPSGRIILDSDSPISIDNTVVVENFDPTITSGSYYTVGTFFDSFKSWSAETNLLSLTQMEFLKNINPTGINTTSMTTPATLYHLIAKYIKDCNRRFVATSPDNVPSGIQLSRVIS